MKPLPVSSVDTAHHIARSLFLQPIVLARCFASCSETIARGLRPVRFSCFANSARPAALPVHRGLTLQESCVAWSATVSYTIDAMNDVQEQLIKRAKTLLQEKRVDGILGFSRGTLPMANRPFWARSLEDAELLCWDAFCLANLANFVPFETEEKLAVIAKGCDWRNLVVHHQEGRLDLSRVYVIGIDCDGMLDPEKIRRAAGGPERVLDVHCAGEQVTISVPKGEVVIDRVHAYRQSCLECIQRAPISADELLQNPETPKFPDSVQTSDQESQDAGTREEALKHQFKDCLMCFACRDICPLCYCTQCFVDVEKSHWLTAQASIDKILDFHFFRAHHIAGRCTECGACESACPMNISVRQLVTKLNRNIKESSKYIPGLELEAEAPDGIFRPSYHEHSRRQI